MKTKTISRRYRVVEVAPGCQIHRHHRAWISGEKLKVRPRDAEMLLERGTVKEVG